MVKLNVAWIGKTKDPAIQALTEKYLKRLAHYSEVKSFSLKDEAALERLSAPSAGPRQTLILLDRRGIALSSEELAKFLSDQQERSSAPVLFAVGPADGFTDQILKLSAFKLSLGKITLAHELARVVLLEQLYRAFTIIHRHPYHSGH